MGYYTTFELTVQVQPQKSDKCLKCNTPIAANAKFCINCGQPLSAEIDASFIIERFREENGNAKYALTKDGSRSESTKWYNYEAELKEFSTQFPTALFTLKGDGEENGDMWVLYVKNGKSQKCKAQITFEPYDEKKLR